MYFIIFYFFFFSIPFPQSPNPICPIPNSLLFSIHFRLPIGIRSQTKPQILNQIYQMSFAALVVLPFPIFLLYFSSQFIYLTRIGTKIYYLHFSKSEPLPKRSSQSDQNYFSHKWKIINRKSQPIHQSTIAPIHL